MSGYFGYSMSNNAVAAYDDGLVPASKITGVPAALVREFCRRAEWHHTSSHFNRTDFYRPSEVRAVFGLEVSEDYDAVPSAVAALAAWKAAKKIGKTANNHENCRVEWLEWSGSRKHPKCTKRTADGCRVEVKGVTATITLPDGSLLVKRLETRGFSFKK